MSVTAHCRINSAIGSTTGKRNAVPDFNNFEYRLKVNLLNQLSSLTPNSGAVESKQTKNEVKFSVCQIMNSES